MILDLLVLSIFSGICFGVGFLYYRIRGKWNFETRQISMEVGFWSGVALGIILLAVGLLPKMLDVEGKGGSEIYARLLFKSVMSLVIYASLFKSLQRRLGLKPAGEGRVGDEVQCTSCHKPYDFSGEAKCPWCGFQEIGKIG